MSGLCLKKYLFPIFYFAIGDFFSVDTSLYYHENEIHFTNFFIFLYCHYFATATAIITILPLPQGFPLLNSFILLLPASCYWRNSSRTRVCANWFCTLRFFFILKIRFFYYLQTYLKKSLHICCMQYCILSVFVFVLQSFV